MSIFNSKISIPSFVEATNCPTVMEVSNNFKVIGEYEVGIAAPKLMCWLKRRTVMKPLSQLITKSLPIVL